MINMHRSCSLLHLVGVVLVCGCQASVLGGDGGVADQEVVPPGWEPRPPKLDGPTPPSDFSSPPQGQLATWVPIDWAAFPVDPGPSYKVSGRTWVVKTTGSDSNDGTDAQPLRSIATALSRSKSGDLVRVHAGTYTELMSEDFNALVMDKDNVVLTAAPGEKVTVKPKSGMRYGLVLRGSNIVANGINLDGFNPSIDFGREDKTQRNVVVTNITATTSVPEADGICDYADTNAAGFPSIDGLLLKNVTMIGAALGISCNSGPCKSWRLENVRVQNASGAGSGSDAIGVENGDNMLFYRVEATGAVADGIDTKATRVVVWDCHVHHVERNGVKFWGGGDIVNTRIHHTGADAAIQVRGARARILHSVVGYHNYGSGESYNLTYCYDGPNCDGALKMEIIDSIFFNTSGGSYFKGGTLTIENSLFHGMENGRILEFGSTVISVSEGAAAFSARGLGGGNIVADPQLDSSTMRPKASSPGNNKGKTLSSNYPQYDGEGKPRVKSGTPDLGAFEDY
jgi:hypothetical protein